MPVKKSKTLFVLLATIFPILFFYIIAIYYSNNIPWFDDIENIPFFLVEWLRKKSFIDKLGALFRPNNEHRVLYARLVVLLEYFITGKINFQVLSFIGNLSVAGIWVLLVVNFKKSKLAYYWTLPTIFFLFNLQFYAMTFMTIMSLQYQLVIFLSFLSFYFLNKPGRTYFWLAVGVAWLDTFSMGNGMMVWPSGLVLLLLQGRWKELGSWVLMAAAAIFFYFSGYDFVQGNDKGFAYILANPIRIFVGLLGMIGGIFDIFPTLSFQKRMLIPAGMGALLLSFLLYWVGLVFSNSAYWHTRVSPKLARIFWVSFLNHNRDRSADGFWLAALTYLLISMVLVVFFRTRFNYELVLWSTYKLYPGTFAAICYLQLILFSPPRFQKYIFTIALLGALLAWGTSYYYYLPEVASIQKTRQAFAFNQRYNGIGLGASKGTAFAPVVANTLDETSNKGIYRLPNPIVHQNEENLIPYQPEGTIDLSLHETPESVFVELEDGTFKPATDHYVVLKSPRYIYLFYIDPRRNEADCPKATLHSGEYKVGIWVIEGQQTKLLASNHRVIIH